MDSPPYEQVQQSDIPPKYASSLDLTGRLLCKHELATPNTKAFHRCWRRVEAELRGTTLLLSETMAPARSSTKTTARYFRAYTLQAGDAGLASDDSRRTDVFRARVEGEQLLFIAPGREAAMMWVESLLMATSISEPLETRKMPGYPSILPRSRKSPREEPEPWFGQRLWSELAWKSRHRREWLLEGQTRSRKERWRKVISAQDVVQPRRSFDFSISGLGPQLGADDRVWSTRPHCQCPSSSCWGNDSPWGPIGRIAEEKGMFGAGDDQPRSLPRPSCTRTLTKWGKWNSAFYVKDGRRINVPPRPAWIESKGTI